MPRDPHFNPTERIGRILEEVEELEDYAKMLRGRLEESGSLLSLPAYPLLESIIQERAFRHRNLGQVLATRESARKRRSDSIEVGGLSEKAKEDLEKLLKDI